MALLDTTALIDLGRRRNTALHRRAVAALQRGDTLFTSRINEAEFRVGPEMAHDRARELQRVERILSGMVILEFTADAARRYAVIKALLLKAGRPAGDCDLLIAAVAMAHGEPLVTHNAKHFANIPGLVVESY